MLKIAKGSDFERLQRFCKGNAFGAYICCRAEAYGFSSSFSKLWIGENADEKITCAVSSLDRNAVLLADGECDFDELAFMISALGISSVLTDEMTAEKCKMPSFETKPVFCFENACGYIETEDAEISDMKAVYALFCSCFPNRYLNDKESFLSWLSDFTFRKNRNLARLETAICGSKLVAAALTAAECKTDAVISSVACDEEFRRRGFGKSVVLSLAKKLKDENKNVFVIAENNELSAFYKKIGFKNCGFAAYTERL